MRSPLHAANEQPAERAHFKHGKEEGNDERGAFSKGAQTAQSGGRGRRPPHGEAAVQIRHPRKRARRALDGSAAALRRPARSERHPFIPRRGPRARALPHRRGTGRTYRLPQGGLSRRLRAAESPLRDERCRMPSAAGRAHELCFYDNDYDVRVSSFPTIFGERFVLRILPRICPYTWEELVSCPEEEAAIKGCSPSGSCF